MEGDDVSSSSSSRMSAVNILLLVLEWLFRRFFEDVFSLSLRLNVLQEQDKEKKFRKGDERQVIRCSH